MSKIIKTARLLLRPPERSDVPGLVPLLNNWKIASMVGRIPFPYEPADAEAWLAGLAEKPQDRVLAIVSKAGLVGGVGLHAHEEHYELGYWIGAPYWRRGYASEAGRALLSAAFSQKEIELVRAAHFIDNPASGRVLQKLGFRYNGEGRRPCLARGCEVVSHEMSLSRADWYQS